MRFIVEKAGSFEAVDPTTVRSYNNRDFHLHHVIYRSHAASHLRYKQKVAISFSIRSQQDSNRGPFALPVGEFQVMRWIGGGTGASSDTADGCRPQGFYGSLIILTSSDLAPVLASTVKMFPTPGA